MRLNFSSKLCPRFSLRVLIIATAIIALCLYWRTRPDRLATSFEELLAQQRYGEANALLVDQDHVNLEAWSAKCKKMDVKATFAEPSIADWLLGRRRGTYVASFTTDRHSIAQDGTLTVSATGIELLPVSEARNDLPSWTQRAGWILDVF